MLRTRLYADPGGVFLHDLILAACRRFPGKMALVDPSLSPARRFTYAEYGETIEALARGLVAAGIQPGERIAIYLPNSWEFCAAYHAATFAGAIPTPLNPSYREREVRYHLQDSGAVMLITDGPLIASMDLSGLPDLRRLIATRDPAATAAEPFATLLRPVSASMPHHDADTQQTLAALPYSSGTTGLPKGVMLSHHNLVANVYQVLGPDCMPFRPQEISLCFLPLYHIYGLNVVLNPTLALGATLVLMPRFDTARATQLIRDEAVTFIPCVPPVLNLFSQAAERGEFPRDHHVRWAKSGAAPLAPELARRFTSLTGIAVAQGYGMTEASPVTHVGFEHGPLAKVESIGQPVAFTECVLLGENNTEVPLGEPGELVMRGPQIMLGYWNSPQSTADVLHPLPMEAARRQPTADSREPLWYFSGDVARMDRDGLFYIVDRRKEMIKYKGFPVSPAEVESVLLEHPAVRDCGVVGCPDDLAGEIPCAFIVLREGFTASPKLQSDICGYVGERLTGYKQPRDVRFVSAIPRNPSGKILRRTLREQL